MGKIERDVFEGILDELEVGHGKNELKKAYKKAKDKKYIHERIASKQKQQKKKIQEEREEGRNDKNRKQEKEKEEKSDSQNMMKLLRGIYALIALKGIISTVIE